LSLYEPLARNFCKAFRFFDHRLLLFEYLDIIRFHPTQLSDKMIHVSDAHDDSFTDQQLPAAELSPTPPPPFSRETSLSPHLNSPLNTPFSLFFFLFLFCLILLDGCRPCFFDTQYFLPPKTFSCTLRRVALLLLPPFPGPARFTSKPHTPSLGLKGFGSYLILFCTRMFTMDAHISPVTLQLGNCRLFCFLR